MILHDVAFINTKRLFIDEFYLAIEQTWWAVLLSMSCDLKEIFKKKIKMEKI